MKLLIEVGRSEVCASEHVCIRIVQTVVATCNRSSNDVKAAQTCTD